MDIGKAIKYLYPNAVQFVDYELRDDSDGQGVKIVKWNLGVMPTLEELQAASDAYDTLKAQKDSNDTHLSYLASTDWYAIRFIETGVPIPEDIKAARQAARDAIVAV